MNIPILYTFRRCPYAIRARMGLALNNIDVQSHEVSFRNKPAAMLEASPKGTVPVLILWDQVLEESIDIIYWAFQMNNDQRFLQGEEKTRAFVFKYDQLFKTSLTYYKYADMHPQKSAKEYRQDCESFMRHFEQRLKTNEFLFSDHMEIVDLCMFPFIRQLSKVDESWFAVALYPHLKRWKTFFDTSDFFAKVMEKTGDSHQIGDTRA